MTMTTKELLALVERWRSVVNAYGVGLQTSRSIAYQECADELAPIATALCAEVEATNALLTEANRMMQHHADMATQRSLELAAAEAQVEALREGLAALIEKKRRQADMADHENASAYGKGVASAMRVVSDEMASLLLNFAAIDAAKEPK